MFMKVKIKLFDSSLPMPEYKTSGAAALDLYSRLDLEISPGEVAYVPLNIALQIPEDVSSQFAAEKRFNDGQWNWHW